MSFHFSADDLDTIHEVLVETLLIDPDFEASPRGQPVKELIGASFTLMNPRARLIASPARAVNYGFAVGEFCWYARGDNDLETMAYYNKRMPQFSDDGKTLNSAYGDRMFSCDHQTLTSQWDAARTELLRDPDSRRAVMVINQPRDLGRAVIYGSKDVPCTLALQLLIRDRRLHMSVTMRSNDVWWGLPYDVFSFTCLQECFLLDLKDMGCPVDELGQYHHHAGSLHIYDRHFDAGRAVIDEGPSRIRSTPMAPFDKETIKDVYCTIEPDVRAGNDPKTTNYLNFVSEMWMVGELLAHRQKRLKESQEKK